MIDENTPLRGKQAAFVECYVICNFNGTAAARMAGYRGNDATLAAIAYENLNKPHIKAAIERKMKALTMAADEVLLRISQQAAVGYAAYLRPDGTVDLTRLLADGMGHLIKGFKHTKFGVEVEFFDAQKALGLLGKHHGLFGANGREDNPVHIKVVGLDEALNRIYGDEGNNDA